MQIPKNRRLSKSKDLSDIMKVEILSLSVTFVYGFENYRGILNSLLNLEALMLWKMVVFENQLLDANFTENGYPKNHLT